MEAYHLYESGFQYSFQRDDMKKLKSIYDDYVQKSDVDLIVDEYIQKPETIEDSFYITNLDIVLSLSNKYPNFSRRINVPSLGKIMTERGFDSKRKGKNRTTCYVISKNSIILQHLDDESQTWKINHGHLVG